ncbi:transporter [Ameyamaea chiangmaiensis NBRC 103196]|uniref:Lysylphosphatidylglycerol synthetase family protein n=1 Tax=Ameyamaea chiangmaiensis TaxID=442969 RepID=A0A850PBK8_9PROT|nr:lysylphosphatidylglycerol synthase domain-containing protein [Ameyamaea chiangmaiensis]MBS4074339.1 lysylphosphatidylglycerol synthetase family protein [Ameyamaea chiangmaiensis]NVN40313.1 lysylphosphatidylglycerol synthetase family protein [Ameyamaea chiangmaiensis]GBQ71696.1 transporter [Ameyamaea chiangmaiensis NBRC 103196]
MTSSSPEPRVVPSERDQWWRGYLRHLPHLLGVVLMLAAIGVMQHEVRTLHFADIRQAIAAMPVRSLLAGVGCTVLSYFILSFYDRLAVIHVGERVSFRRTAFAAFCSYVLSHNLGFSAISGAAVRFRLYRNWGVSSVVVAQIIAFCSTTYLLGAAALIGGILLLEPGAVPMLGPHVPLWGLRLIGCGLWIGLAAYVVLSVRVRMVKLFGHVIELPRTGMAIAQTAVASLELAATAAIAYVLLPADVSLGFGAFIAIYLASYTAGLVASVPGGLGVFDGAMMLALGYYMAPAQIIGVILIFRLFYYIAPLILAGLMFAGHELFLRGDAALARRAAGEKAPERGPRKARPSQVIRESEADFSVVVATAGVSASGLMLLAIAILAPMDDAQGAHGLRWLESVTGDYLLSLVGMALIGLALGLAQRVTLAWKATLGLLGLACLVTLLRGTMLVVPGLLALVAFLIAPFRSCYYRRARLLSEPLAPATLTALFLLLGSVTVLVVLGPHPDEDSTWWQLVLFSPGPIRWAIVLSVLLGLVTIARLLQRGELLVWPWNEEAHALYRGLDHALEDFGARRPNGLIVGDASAAALPFCRTERYLIGLGDPAGAEVACASAIWKLRDLAAQEGRGLAFWRVGKTLLRAYEDMGLTAWPMSGKVEQFVCCAAEDYSRLRDVMVRESRKSAEVAARRGLAGSARRDREGHGPGPAP